jgi:hypothetical protein
MSEGVPFEMREQERLQPTLDAAQAYGQRHPDAFGGLYWKWQPVMHVETFFTEQVEAHLAALRALVRHPDRIEARPCHYTEAQNHAWQNEILQRIDGRWSTLAVTTVGPIRTENGYVPQVGIWPWTEDQAERIRRELSPIPVELVPDQGAVPL